MTNDAAAYAAQPWLAQYRPAGATDFAREGPDTLASFLAVARADPERIAIRYFDGSLSFGELDRHAARCAAWLLHNGARPGDRIFIILQNVPQFAIVALAAWRAGLIPVLGNPMYRAAELSRLFDDSGATVIVCHRDHVEEVRRAAGDQPTLVTVSPYSFQTADDRRTLPPSRPKQAAPDLDDILAEAVPRAEPLLERIETPIALLLYTSGTTGVPKAAMLTPRNLSYVTEASTQWFELGPQSRILAVAPLFHITGFALHLCLGLAIGAQTILFHRFEPNVALDAIVAHRPTFTIGAATAFIALMNVAQATPDQMRSFDRIYSGGAPIPPALVEEFRLRMGQAIHSSYGMTETTAPTHLAPFGADIPVDPAFGALSIGIPIFEVEAAILDEDGNHCPVGTAGELVVRGPQVMKGYWQRPDETAAALRDGWMHTGDVALMDADGWFYLVDRKKDMINASGYKVWPREVEDALYRHPAVREAGVVGVPDAYRGETVHAFVSLKADNAVTSDELVAFAREHLAAYKCPRQIVILPDLPKTESGKITRNLLRSLA